MTGAVSGLPSRPPAVSVCPADLRRLESDIRYQLRRAPFGLTWGDLRDHLNEDGSRFVTIVAVQRAVDRLVLAEDVRIEKRGELDYVCAATPAHRRAPPQSILAHRGTQRPLGDITQPASLPEGLGQRLARPCLPSDVTWDGLAPPKGRGADRSLDASTGILGGFVVGALILAAMVLLASAWGWL